MPCEYCLRYCEHDRRCPNYTPIDTGVVCDICGEIIEYGDEYVENEMGECSFYTTLAEEKGFSEQYKSYNNIRINGFRGLKAYVLWIL